MAAELVIGIDIGMSGTGVAYSWGGGAVDALRWGDHDAPKIPTRLVYDANKPASKPLGWGFEVPSACITGMQVQEYFKVDLERSDAARGLVHRTYREYMSLLYKELQARFPFMDDMEKLWEGTSIQFLFSTPCKWPPHIVDLFISLAREAGFGEYPHHSVSASLTEPQAVAAFQLRGQGSRSDQKIQDGHHVLVVDAGAGTGDFCLLKIEDDGHGNAQGIELNPVAGAKIGSSYIDRGFESFAQTFLEPMERYLCRPAGEVAWELRQSDLFQDEKLSFAPQASKKTLELPIPHLKDSRSSPHTRMGFPREDLRALFDEQADLLIRGTCKILMDLDRPDKKPTVPDEADIRRKLADVSLDCILLSGGLGGSPYIGHRFAETFAHAGQKKTRVMVSKEPQLSVCLGLVYHAIANPLIFPRRLCRASFGISCKIPARRGDAGKRWDEIQRRAQREGRVPERDDRGNKWFDGCVDWFIKKGEEVVDSGIVSFEHSCIFSPNVDSSKRICEVRLLTSLEEDPSPFEDEGTTHGLVSFRVDLSRVPKADVTKLKGSVYRKMLGQKPYNKVQFIIEATIGLADAKFQCFTMDKTVRLSEPIHQRMGETLEPTYGGVVEMEA